MSKASAVDLAIDAIAEANDITTERAAEIYTQRSEYAQDLTNLPKQQHNWIKRGIKVSCEGADHPHHSHFLRSMPM